MRESIFIDLELFCQRPHVVKGGGLLVASARFSTRLPPSLPDRVRMFLIALSALLLFVLLLPLVILRSSSPQVTSDPAGDTLIPLPLQGKDNHLLQQLLPSLLNPAVLGGSLPAGNNLGLQGHLDGCRLC